MPILCSHGSLRIILLAEQMASCKSLPATIPFGTGGRRSQRPRPHVGHGFFPCALTAICRHRAPSPLKSNPLTIFGLVHGNPQRFRMSQIYLLHPFAGFGWADTTGGGGARSSCTVECMGKRSACGASCCCMCLPFATGADTAVELP